MINKERDTLYCGVRKSVIEGAKPKLNMENVAHFMEFTIERYRIHKRKDIKMDPAPWTSNQVLKEFRFTNVRREHDRQTKHLIETVSLNEKLSLEDKIVNSFMFRAWNNYDTFNDFDFPYPAKVIYNPKLKEQIRPEYERLNKLDPDRMWWSNAYNQGGTKSAWKFPDVDGYQKAYSESKARNYTDWEEDIPLRPFHIGPWLKNQDIVKKLLKSKDQQECFNVIKEVRGFADFLAYQVFVDLTYIPEFPFSENEFVVAGPGCKRGLDLIFKDFDDMDYSEAMFWLRDNHTKIFNEATKLGMTDYRWNPYNLYNDLPKEDRFLSVMSIENCMCELSKYVKAVNGTGRPRNKYKPKK